MNAFKFSAVALALATSFSASAMAPMQEADLAQVSGQEGMSIIADLNVNIGAFTYTDDGASVSFNNVGIKGMMVVTIDLLTDVGFRNAGVVALASYGFAAADANNLMTAYGLATGMTGQDVVQFAFPVAGTPAPSITVASITTGHGGASMGGIQINKLDLQGTKVWMYGHN